MTTLLPKPLRSFLGITPGNIFNVPVIVATIATGVILLVLLLGSIFGAPQFRVAAAVGFFVGMIALPILLFALILASRHNGRVLRIKAGDYLAKWTYDEQERRRWKQWNSEWLGDEVIISTEGVIWSGYRYGMREFASGVKRAEIVREDDQPPMLKVSYFRRHHRWEFYVIYRIHEQHMTLLVPIPEGREDEAKHVMDALNWQTDMPTQVTNEQWWLSWATIGFFVIALVFGFTVIVPLEIERMRGESNLSATQRAVRRADEFLEISAAFEPLRPVIEEHFAEWTEDPERYFRYLTAEEAGFSPDDNIREVVSGYCSDGYMVLLIERDNTIMPFMGETRAFLHTNSANRYACLPAYWEINSTDSAPDEWLYVTLNTSRATLVPMVTAIMATRQAVVTPTPPPGSQ